MSTMHPPIRTEADAQPPRPGWAKAIGICHLVVATLMSFAMLISLFWVTILATAKPAQGAGPALMGFGDPRYLWFVALDALTGLVGNGLTFASGLALINLKAWGARIWRWLAPAKVARLIIVWVGFVISVAPAVASGMARSALQMFQQQQRGAGKIPTEGELALVYAWACLAMAIGMIVLGSIYPAVTWWLVGRPGVRSALTDQGVSLAPPASGEVSPS